MSMWTRIQIALGLLGLLLAFGGDRLSIPLLFYTGVACFGMTSMAIGWEAIVTQQIVGGRRRSGNRGTYTGVPAIFQGVQFNLIGLFLIIVAVMIYTNTDGRAVFLQMVRRPGVPLIFLGGLCLMQAVITLSGSLEMKHGPRWEVILNLLAARMLPGTILIVMGLGAMGLGLFEILAPNTFDEKGGGFLEMLYGLR
jgi:hypothetical protein